MKDLKNFELTSEQKKALEKKPWIIFCKQDKTKQEFKNECDINQIIKQFEKTGMLSSVNTRQPIYADVSNIPDYQSALNVVRQSNEMFDALPSGVRNKFQNTPAEMIRWLENPKNHDEAVKLGLLKAPEPKSGSGGSSGSKTDPENPDLKKNPEKSPISEKKGEKET